MSHRCAVDVADSTGALRIRVSGEVDMACAPDLLGTIVSADVPAGGNLILDLAGVSFMDSSGINALVAAHHKRAAEGVPMTIVGTRPIVLQVFKVSGVDRFLDVRPAEQDDEVFG
jgi:stage II sporulation protein AA (anti-sigma F factor antagonist)